MWFGSCAIHRHPAGLGVPRETSGQAIQRQNEYDHGRFAAAFGYVADRNLARSEREEQHFELRGHAVAWRDAKNRMVHATAHSPRDAEWGFLQENHRRMRGR